MIFKGLEIFKQLDDLVFIAICQGYIEFVLVLVAIVFNYELAAHLDLDVALSQHCHFTFGKKGSRKTIFSYFI